MCKRHLSGAFYYVTSIHTHVQLITEASWLYLNIRHFAAANRLCHHSFKRSVADFTAQL